MVTETGTSDEARGRAKGVADGLLAVLAVGYYAAVVFVATFSRKEWYDTVAYALPAANLVERGGLSLPQLGSQLGLDRFWLLNAPWIALGPAPWMWALGAGRVPNLVGLVVLGVVGGAVTVWAVRRAMGLGSWGMAAVGALPFLLHRAALSEFYNQRYTAIAANLLTLSFLPPTAGPGRGRAWWQWLAAGSLPLVHPSLLPASGVWLLGEAPGWFRGPRAGAKSWAGPVAFAVGAALTAAWYGRLELLRVQFLPHLRFGNYRTLGALHGLLTVSASPVASVPSLALNLLVVGLAVGLTLGAFWPTARRRVVPALLPAAAIGLLLPLDALRGFQYYPAYYLGIGPCLASAFATGRARRAACAVLGLLAAGHLGVSWKLDRQPADLTTTAQGLQFVRDHTRPNDRLVLGPPFVLVSAPPRLPDGRTAPRVVPMDYYLDTFDRDAFVRDIQAHCDVYVGEAEWFYRPVWVDLARGAPLFPGAEITPFDFRGQPVIVARSRPGTRLAWPEEPRSQRAKRTRGDDGTVR